ncbi:MAG: hypothetical protein N3I35_05035 [Clostridia bacterium]|nr:hypothetical protein [Clostridia bacterium]
MSKKRLICFILSLVLILSLNSAAFASDSETELPTLKLSVQQSLLHIYPPIMIYTAQLSFIPPSPSTALKVEFYNIVPGPTPTSPTQVVFLGSAPVDSTGKAVLSKQIMPGTYTAISKIVISTNTIWSNKVDYKVY